MVDFCVQTYINRLLNYQYDIGVKGHCHIYFKPVTAYHEFLFHFDDHRLHIWHNDCAPCVDYNMGLRKRIWSRSNITKICLIAPNVNFPFMMEGVRIKHNECL